jgi:hypothetical protein
MHARLIRSDEMETLAGTKSMAAARASILSDPRLSQLFALSSQLEALAESFSTPSPPPPELPPKAATATANGDYSNHGLTLPQLPPKSAALQQRYFSPEKRMPASSASSYEITYRRLTDDEEDAEELNGAGFDEDFSELMNSAPAPRYSALSDSFMSTSSHTLFDFGGVTNGASAAETPSSTTSSGGKMAVATVCDVLEAEDEANSNAADTTDGFDPWKSRCFELEMSLQQFRDQAQNIREMLRMKVRDWHKPNSKQK